MPKHVPPSVNSKSFSCPRCGAHADQTWLSMHAARLENLPTIWTEERIAKAKREFDSHDEQEVLKKHLPSLERLTLGDPIIRQNKNSSYVAYDADNLSVSWCYSCNEISVWRHDSILYPPSRYEVEPNPNLPPDISADFDEARQLLDMSPRAAAALLRLCIQKLCKLLGGDGENINNDIGALVKKGLPAKVQKALDTVRVVGNNAVHPGQLDLKDDRDTAAKLFTLVNLIAHAMITEPKEVDALFDTKVPAGAKAAIAKRDGGAGAP
jgi:hypothetical protein